VLRIVELLGLLAPVAGGILLFLYRRRSMLAFTWGVVACVLGLIASGMGLIGVRFSIVSAYRSDSGVDGVLEMLDVWILLRFGLLFVAGLVLVIAAIVDRESKPPISWITVGLAVMVSGLGAHFIEPDLGAGHERLGRILAVFIEIIQHGLLGVGFLILCVAAMANRPDDDDRIEPTELFRNVGGAAWRSYLDIRRGNS